MVDQLSRQLDLKASLSKLASLKKRAMEGESDSLTIEKIQEKSSQPHYRGPMCPMSPASIEAYQTLGIDPEMLRYHPFDHYMKKYGNRVDLAKIEHQHNDTRRKEAFATLISTRDSIRQSHALKMQEGVSKGEASRLDDVMNSMAAREKHRLEMARRQREKEIQMMKSMEKLRQESQQKFNQKILLLEERQSAKNEERKRMEESRKRHQLEQLREKKKKEKERDLKLRLALEQRSKQESDRRKRDHQHERQLQRARSQRAAEKREKILAMKNKSDSFRMMQLQEHQKRIKELNDREKRLEQKKRMKQILLENDSKTRQFAARERLRAVKNKLQTSKLMKERAFREREARVTDRQKQRIREKEIQEKKRQQKEKDKLNVKRKLQLAKLKEDEERNYLMEKKYADKRNHLNEKLSLSRLEKERQALISRLHLEDKQRRAITTQRRDAYEQEVRAQKLEEQNRRAEVLLSKREELQKARRLANEQASIQRRKITSTVSIQA